MKGSETKMLGFMEGADKRFVIPVYQRKYDWKYDNCRQMYEDLKKIINNRRDSHFFGSIVSSVVANGSKIEYHIIDGQQRLTTLTLLLLAIRNLIVQKRVVTLDEKLDEQISQRYLISQWVSEDDRIKLRPIKSDKEALVKLFGDKEDYDYSSNLTINYLFFYETILKDEISVVDLFSAIGKLEIISITLDQNDNAQLIFESLNSTGLALTEGDKIRNYILMGLPAQNQMSYYDTYWAKIEKCTKNDVSGFIRDYLSIKQQTTPTINNVYSAFKRYTESGSLTVDTLLKDILKYARFFEKLLLCKSELNEQILDDCLYRLMRLDIVVTRPFLMEVLRLNQDGKLENSDVLSIFSITENYLFRRNICEVPTNALNKIFLNLNKEIIRYDNTTNDYVKKFIYTLLSKKESGRFPDDEEFTTSLINKQIYLMRGKYKAYLFERFENFGTIETKDVFTHIDNNTYTIEHIMPQHLTPAWIELLGANANEIHETWLHRLANLTLTGYNPNLSNNTFIEKRDAKEGGYAVSGIKMNQKIARKSSWGLTELMERNDEMVTLAKEIWAYPVTNFIPKEKEYDSCTLDDENYDLTGRDIVKYSYINASHIVTSWTDMFEHVIKYLHQKDKSILMGIAYKTQEITELSAYIRNNEEELRSALKIDENIFIEKNTSTATKMFILRRIFSLCEADPMDLVFYMKDTDTRKIAADDKLDIRKKYWEYALPIIQNRHLHRGSFSNCSPTSSNSTSGYFGISGFSISCVANLENARIDFCLASNQKKNKEAFDILYSHKDEIEATLGILLSWYRSDETKASYICYYLNDVSIANESDWPRMAEFHAKWSDMICETMLKYLKTDDNSNGSSIVGILREWVTVQDGFNINLAKCNRKYTRFTTDCLSTILPDIPNAPSGWNTDNHYFYEIINQNGKEIYIQLSISSTNITEEFRMICDRINDYYPARINKKEWQWRTPFKTMKKYINDELNEDAIIISLDECKEEILAFEENLTSKMKS